MDINIKLLKFQVNLVRNINKIITENLEQFTKHIKHLDIIISNINDVLAETYILANPFVATLHCRHFIKLTSKQNVCAKNLKLFITADLRRHKTLVIGELLKLVHGLSNDFYKIIINNYEHCIDCNKFLIRHRNELFCQHCMVFREKIFLSKDEELEEDIKQNKSNIAKHYEVTINKIYGIIDEKSALPECALVALKAKLVEMGFDIKKQVHYSYSLINQLKRIKNLKCTCAKKTHNVAVEKKQVNYIIKKLYPELVIPKMVAAEAITVKNLFLKISSVFQQLFPNNYSNNYQYTFHRILSLIYYRREHIMQLLRFIYLQKSSSFESKDEKLKKVNEHAKCFQNFYPLPSNIYTEISHYRIKRA